MNGNIQCFSGDHTYLGLLAIVILGLCVSVIPLSLVYIMGWLQVSKNSGTVVLSCRTMSALEGIVMKFC